MNKTQEIHYALHRRQDRRSRQLAQPLPRSWRTVAVTNAIRPQGRRCRARTTDSATHNMLELRPEAGGINPGDVVGIGFMAPWKGFVGDA